MEGAVLCEVELKENEVDQTVMGAADAVKATATEETEAAANSGNGGATAAFTDQEIRRRSRDTTAVNAGENSKGRGSGLRAARAKKEVKEVSIGITLAVPS